MGQANFIKFSAQQLSSGLMRAIIAHQKPTREEVESWDYHISKLHMHDGSQAPIAWNDLSAIQIYNEFTGENIPEPLMPSEGYNQHGHTSEYDGGYIPGMGPHDHRDNFNGGMAFAVFHPGTAIPQMPYAI